MKEQSRRVVFNKKQTNLKKDFERNKNQIKLDPNESKAHQGLKIDLQGMLRNFDQEVAQETKDKKQQKNEKQRNKKAPSM